MIYDTLDNLGLYQNIPHLEKILHFINSNDLSKLSLGRHEIDGEQLYASIDSYSTFPESERRFEIHHHHADLQLMISGRELLQVAFPSDLREELPKEGEGDFFFHSIRSHSHSPLLLEDRRFVFIPAYHPHRPCLQVAENTTDSVRKVVFKIRS